jgi:RNase H-fold protein (predicted Holliday junction resolvase)
MGDKLSQQLAIEVVYWDEYLSSKQAESKSKKNIDSGSAKIILQEYLNSK